jgi:hypothetical protein
VQGNQLSKVATRLLPAALFARYILVRGRARALAGRHAVAIQRETGTNKPPELVMFRRWRRNGLVREVQFAQSLASNFCQTNP